MKKENLKFLLIQIRQNEHVKAEEHDSFARYAGVSIEQIDTWDVFQKPQFDGELFKQYHAFFIGGASEASVLDPEHYPFVPAMIELIQKAVQINFPIFASCFGFQLAILAFGGNIVRDTQNFEMGTYPMQLTPAANVDPIYANIPEHFMAVSVHQEKATQLPAKCELLAYTKDCIHSFRYDNKSFWAFQFHPELDCPTLTERLNAYKEKYTEDLAHFESIIASLKPTSEANQLVGNFVDYLIFTLNSEYSTS